jgi:hypothetical protein
MAASGAATFREQQRVYYHDTQGKRHRAKVLAVHHDDRTPYYTIRLYRNARELQTIATRLRAIRATPR